MELAESVRVIAGRTNVQCNKDDGRLDVSQRPTASTIFCSMSYGSLHGLQLKSENLQEREEADGDVRTDDYGEKTCSLKM